MARRKSSAGRRARRAAASQAGPGRPPVRRSSCPAAAEEAAAGAAAAQLPPAVVRASRAPGVRAPGLARGCQPPFAAPRRCSAAQLSKYPRLVERLSATQPGRSSPARARLARSPLRRAPVPRLRTRVKPTVGFRIPPTLWPQDRSSSCSARSRQRRSSESRRRQQPALLLQGSCSGYSGSLRCSRWKTRGFLERLRRAGSERAGPVRPARCHPRG